MAAKLLPLPVLSFDLKFRLLAPGFLLETGLVAVYRQALSYFTLRALPL